MHAEPSTHSLTAFCAIVFCAVFQPNWVAFRPPGGGASSLLNNVAGKFVTNVIPRDARPLTDAAVAPVKQLSLGSVLGDGGSAPEPNNAAAWRKQADVLQRAASESSAGVPLLIGNDSVHGQNNLKDSTLIPHHIGQGCLRDSSGKPDAGLVRELAAVSAKETYACGINWIFSPCVTVPHDLRWGRTYEGFSEDAEIVAVLGAAEVDGLQASGVPMAACLKHFVADGGTSYGTGTNLFWFSGAPTHVCDHGDAMCDDESLRAEHLRAYLPSLRAGCTTVMASYSSYRGLKMHRHRALLTGVLKEELGFDGLLVSDYNAINHLGGHFGDTVAECIEAGIDLVMTAGGLVGLAGDLAYAQQIDACVDAVKRGKLSRARLDDAVLRNLRVKMAIGLIPRANGALSPPPPTGTARHALEDCVGCEAHRRVARRAVHGSLVLLKNRADTLPLRASDGDGLVVMGEGADDVGMQCGGWSLSWMGRRGNAFTSGTTIWQAVRKVCPGATLLNGRNMLHEGAAMMGLGGGLGIAWQLMMPTALQKASTVLLVIGERPYAEGGGDTHAATLRQSDVALIAALARGGTRKVVVILLCGRPLVIPPQTLEQIDALLVAWLPGTEGDGVADGLFGAAQLTGRLSYSWPRDVKQMHMENRKGGAALFDREHGLSYPPERLREGALW